MKRALPLLLVLLLPAFALAQGIILPRPRPMPEPMPIHRPMPPAYALQSIVLDATLKDQVAQVQLAQTFKNTSSRDMEVTFLFPIPHDAAIDKFTLMVDGKELPARMYSKEEARRIYEDIVRSQRDPAILQYMGSGALQTQVFPVPANAERSVVLKYTQICRRDGGLTEFFFPLSTGKLTNKPIGELKLNLRIQSEKEIKSVYSPSHAVDIARPDDNSATIKLAQTNVTSADDLRVFYALGEKAIGATLMSYRPDGKEDGYFLLLAAPEVKPATTQPAAKTVIFTLDRSGSMTGKKIDQAKGALKFVLNNLRPGDTFNIIDYSDAVASFKPELQVYDDKLRDEALRYVDNLYAGGSTNIDGALRRAFEIAADPSRPTYAIFLTDGLPTVGEKNEGKIAENAGSANKSRAKLFTFGVGYDVNARLLDRLSTENHGAADYVKPNEDIEGAVAKFYGRITLPVLTDTAVAIAGTDINRAYPTRLPDLFAGGQVLWVGRYKASGDVKIKVSGKVGDQPRDYEFDAKLADAGTDETYAFVEKLWAVRRIGEIINQLDLKGQNKELVEELVALSTRHGILTPYTAFLADEGTDLRDRAANFGKAAEAAKRDLAVTSGAAGVNQRLMKGQMQQAANAPTAGAQGYFDTEGKKQVVESCQVVGNQALFRRDNRWIDPGLTPEEIKNAEVVEQFSDRYFELARDNGQLRKFLALPEGCTVKVQGKVYQINAAQAPKG